MMFLSALGGFCLLIFFSIVISLSSHSLFFMYLSLELNMISVLPIMASPSGETISSEISLKYFISQSIASIMFLFFYFLSLLSMANFFMLLALIIMFKLGLPPFHSWLSSIVCYGNFKVIYLILVIQKFIPLHILSNLNYSLYVLVFIFFLTLFFVIALLNKMFSIRMMLLVSAWGNSTWIVLSTITSKFWILYLFFYGCFLFVLFLFFHIFSIQTFSSFLNIPFFMKIMICLNFFNLAGLPPFSGFFLKLILLKSFFPLPYVLVILLLLFSLINLYAYTIVSYYVLVSQFSSKVNNASNMVFICMIMSSISLLFFPCLIMMSI